VARPALTFDGGGSLSRWVMPKRLWHGRRPRRQSCSSGDAMRPASSYTGSRCRAEPSRTRGRGARAAREEQASDPIATCHEGCVPSALCAVKHMQPVRPRCWCPAAEFGLLPNSVYWPIADALHPDPLSPPEVHPVDADVGRRGSRCHGVELAVDLDGRQGRRLSGAEQRRFHGHGGQRRRPGRRREVDHTALRRRVHVV
jgi:hypothetical protein